MMLPHVMTRKLKTSPGVFANLLSKEEELTKRIEDEMIDDDEYDTYNYDDDGDNELSEHSPKKSHLDLHVGCA